MRGERLPFSFRALFMMPAILLLASYSVQHRADAFLPYFARGYFVAATTTPTNTVLRCRAAMFTSPSPWIPVWGVPYSGGGGVHTPCTSCRQADKSAGADARGTAIQSAYARMPCRSAAMACNRLCPLDRMNITGYALPYDG